ncbi:MAG: alpha/beta fold hydrolase, partial [Pseudomonadota bacterium]
PAKARRHGRAIAAGWWLLLTLASGLWQLTDSPTPAGGQQVLEFDTPSHGQLAYWDFGPRDGDVIVLIHGTRRGAHALVATAQALAVERRVLLAELPGYGASTATPGLIASATRLEHWLDQLNVSTATVVGHGLGVAVGAHLASRSPERITAWIALTPAGPSVLEGLGDPHLNRALVGLQHAALRLIRWGLPHFGLLDADRLGLSYARHRDANPLDGLEERLQHIEAPALVLIGSDDSARMQARAREHHRRIAQSALTPLPGELDPTNAVPHILAFDSRARRGDAPTLADASLSRLARARAAFDWHEAPRPQGTALLTLLLLLVLATYLSEDLTCIAAGLLVARGTLAFLPATAACMVGIFTSDLALYYLGRHFGRPALQRRPLRWLITTEQLARSERWFDRRGPWAIIASRFVPGSRVPCYVAAGVLRMPFWRFAGWFFVAALVWTPILVGLAWMLGDSLTEILAHWQRWGFAILLLSGASLFALVRLLSVVATHRGRRLLYGRWQRLSRWEFWPPWVFYAPLVVYILYLGVRFRGMTVFTAANPAIPASGFVGESKLDILTG